MVAACQNLPKIASTGNFGCKKKNWECLYTEGKYIQSPKHGTFWHHAWGIQNICLQCTDTPNFIFSIKEGGLKLTLELYNSLLAQLT